MKYVRAVVILRSESARTRRHRSRWSFKLVSVAAEAVDSESIRRTGIIVGEVSYDDLRYPAEIIVDCVWLYHRFPLSFRGVEELLLVRGA